VQDREASLWGGRPKIVAVAAATMALAIPMLGSARASGDDASQLEQECIAAALVKPKVWDVGVSHAGTRGQSLSLKARYGAMPEACHDDDIFKKITDDIYRESSAKPQVFDKGKWRWVNDWYGLFGGIDEGDPSGETTWSNVNNQVAFTGEYFSPPPQADKPTRFQACRVRILLQESAIRPHPLGYKGRKPPRVFSTRIYPINVPPAKISPRDGSTCSLLTPGKDL
jgi:hypothetical protein